MIRFLLGRVAESLVAIFGVVTIVFFVTRILGDPAVLMLPPGATEEQLDAFRREIGLDRPLPVQFGDFVWRILHGDFGRSIQHVRPAFDVVLERMPATLQLAALAIALGVVIGGTAGLLAALYRGTVVELLVMIIALLGQATPIFWLGLMLILLFAERLGWLPTGGSGTGWHLVLPAGVLATFTSASIARLLRSSVVDVLREDYVRTARAKGLMPRTVLTWHIARNGLIPVVTMIGILMGELLGGSVITETVFSWPGVGRVIIQAIEARDFPVVQAGVMMIASTYVAINFLVDLVYGVLDPRIRIRG